MTELTRDVVAIGNAIVDVIARCDDDFLAREGLHKASMRLIDAAEAERLYARMGPGVQISGGSAANTVAGVASLGGSAGFIGRVARDAFGDVFRHDINSLGIAYDTPPAGGVEPTGRCLILVTPDGERTMSTFLGASTGLGPGDLDAAMIAGAKILYLEGYLFDPPEAKQAFHLAVKIAADSGGLVALSLSDRFCVDRHRTEFLSFIEKGVDILFANKDELLSLYQTDDLEKACTAVFRHCRIAAITCSAEGSVIVSGAERIRIATAPVDRVVDTTGAGDLYAAGFLYGHARGLPLDACGRLASLAAGEIISHIGARPETPLSDLAREAGLLG